MQKLLASSNEYVGVMDISTENPVTVTVKQNLTIGFSTNQKNQIYEWTGIAQLKKYQSN